MIIKYSPLPDVRTRIILAPLIPVTFVHKTHDFPTLALVDSGATGAVISTIIAEDLGINWRKLPEQIDLSAAGNFRFRRYDELFLEIFNHKFKVRVSIIKSISPYRCILGQADIFQKAKIIFEGYEKQFEIKFRELN